jgi:hypothetical protein
LIKLIKDLFGEYCCNIDKLSSITSNYTNDFSYLENIRIVIVESIKYLANNDIARLIDEKNIKSKNKKNIIKNISINFSLVCMCEKKPTFDDDIVENVGYIVTSNREYRDNIAYKNDLFLLLIEYLEKYNDGTISINRDCVKLDIRTYEEKVCDEFMNECIEKSTTREKCNDVYNSYIIWNNNKDFGPALTKIKLFSELKKNILYNKSVRFGDIVTSAFIGIKII